MEGYVMRTARIQMKGRLHRSVPGLLVLALVTTGALAGAGQAAAARHGAADVRAPWNAAGRSVAAGTISTVAGGLGGPAKGTKVALGFPVASGTARAASTSTAAGPSRPSCTRRAALPPTAQGTWSSPTSGTTGFAWWPTRAARSTARR